jgi:hypothetical protein
MFPCEPLAKGGRLAMHPFHRPLCRPGLLLASLTALVLSGECGPVPAQPPAAAPAEVDVKVVKLDQLEAAIAAHKGKVVLLDVWSVT